MNDKDKTKVSFFQQHKMLIFCLIPVALLFYLISSGIIASGLWLFLLICPLIHIVMMLGMRGKGHH